MASRSYQLDLSQAANAATIAAIGKRNGVEDHGVTVALAAALHFDVSTPNFMIQEAFAEFDVPWRNDLVAGWNPIRNQWILTR